MRDFPAGIDGLADDMAVQFFLLHDNVTRISPTRAELEDALRALLPRRISIRGESGREVAPVIYMERQHRGARYVFLANRDRESAHRLTVELAGEGGVERWDLETGKTQAMPVRTARGRTLLELGLASSGSAAIVLDPKRPPSRRRPRRADVVKEIALRDEWAVRRSRENSLPLDRCQWRFAGGKWSDEAPVFLAQGELRKQMGLPGIETDSIEQPWVRYAKPSPVAPRAVELCFGFRVSQPPPNGIDLVLESAELFDVEVNGKPVAARKRGWWLDKSMDRVPLKHVRRGENELVLRCDYRDDPEYEIEECYLIGDFGVDRATGAIEAEAEAIRPGDWCDQGYPYYAGNLIYGQDVNLRLRKGDRAVLKIGPHFGACIAVHVNGDLAGVRGWPPYELDVTSKLKPGRNRIEIEICGSPRNLLGPNYYREKRPAWTGPRQFVDRDVIEIPNLVPYGLFGEVTVAILR